MRPHPVAILTLLPLCAWILAPMLAAHPLRQVDASAVTSAPGASAQTADTADGADSADSADRGPPILDEQAVVVQYFRPQHSDARQLVSALANLEGRTFRLRDGNGQVTGVFHNIDDFGNVVVLHDLAAKVTRMADVLLSLDQAAAEEPRRAEDATATLQVVTYVPRFQSCDGLMMALEPYRRTYSNETRDASGATTDTARYDNVVRIPSPAALVLRDTPENLAAMLALLEQLDVRPPQGVFTCRILSPADDGAPAEALPSDLVDNLRRLLPYDAYATRGYSAVRVSIVPGGKVQLTDALGDDGGNFQLELRPSGYDASTGQLSVDNCRFQVPSQAVSLSTSTVITAGQYTVLGVAGRPPLFVVLQFTPEAP